MLENIQQKYNTHFGRYRFTKRMLAKCPQEVSISGRGHKQAAPGKQTLQRNMVEGMDLNKTLT